MVRELNGFKAHLIDGLEGVRDDWRELVGDGAEHGGGGKRRRRCSGKRLTVRSGWIASQDQGEANHGVVVAGVALWRRVGGERSSPELGRRVAMRVAGDRDRPGLFIGHR